MLQRCRLDGRTQLSGSPRVPQLPGEEHGVTDRNRVGYVYLPCQGMRHPVAGEDLLVQLARSCGAEATLQPPEAQPRRLGSRCALDDGLVGLSEHFGADLSRMQHTGRAHLGLQPHDVPVQTGVLLWLRRALATQWRAGLLQAGCPRDEPTRSRTRGACQSHNQGAPRRARRCAARRNAATHREGDCPRGDLRCGLHCVK